MTKVDAKLRRLNSAPRKVRLVVGPLRNLTVAEALKQLRFMNKRAAKPVEKLIRSAVANAEHNFALDINTLRIDSIKVDEGPTLKRYRPKAFGRIAPINRRTSHVTVVLEGEPTGEVPEVKQQKEEKTKKQPAKAEAPSSPQKREKDLTPEKEKGKKEEQKQSFVRRIFRRKSM